MHSYVEDIVSNIVLLYFELYHMPAESNKYRRYNRVRFLHNSDPTAKKQTHQVHYRNAFMYNQYIPTDKLLPLCI